MPGDRVEIFRLDTSSITPKHQINHKPPKDTQLIRFVSQRTKQIIKTNNKSWLSEFELRIGTKNWWERVARKGSGPRHETCPSSAVQRGSSAYILSSTSVLSDPQLLLRDIATLPSVVLLTTASAPMLRLKPVSTWKERSSSPTGTRSSTSKSLLSSGKNAWVAAYFTPRFDNMELKPDLLHGVFAYGFERPSAIQQRAIMPIISGRDCIAQAQSGTGKTATFSVSILQRVSNSGCLSWTSLMRAD